MHHPTDRIAHTFVTPDVEHWLEQEIAQWLHPMKDRSDDPSHHDRTLLPRSCISLHGLLGVMRVGIVGSNPTTDSGGGGGGAKSFTSPYPLKVLARPPRDQKPGSPV